MTHASRSFARASLPAIVPALFAIFVGACALGEAHGYRVVHTDSHVDYAPGAMSLEVATSSGGDASDAVTPADTAAFERAMSSRFEDSTEHYSLVTAETDHEHTVRVTALSFTPAESGTAVAGTVEIVDGTGRTTTALEIEVTVAATGVEAQELAGTAFGERVGHYIEHRDRYHL